MGIRDWLRNLLAGSGPDPLPRIPAGAPSREEVEARLATSRVPGAALAKISDGEIDWVAGYGREGYRGSAHYVSGDTIFQGASLSKPITALCVLTLVNSGLLDLDEDVRPLLDFGIPTHAVVAGQPGTDAAISARMLLRHRGGIAGRGTTPARSGGLLPPDRGGGSPRYKQGRGVRLPTMAESWAGANGATPVAVTYAPGTKFSYSGAGYLVLEHLIETRSETSYRRYAGSLLSSMGAKAATFDVHPPPHFPLARGHDRAGRELRGGHELVPWAGAGGVFTSATSMAEVLATVLRGGGDVLPDSLIDEMVEQGLGVFVRHGTSPSFVHGGDNGGYRASLTGIPSSMSGAVVLTNGRASDGVSLRHDLARLVLTPPPG